MGKKKLIVILSIVGLVNSYIINNTKIDYNLVYRGDIENNSNWITFSNSFDDNNRLFETATIDECKLECASRENCRGIFDNYNNGVEECFGLEKIGNPVNTNSNSYSYIKTVQHHIEQKEHYIEGYVYHSGTPYSGWIYLDLNYNGIYDDSEPIQSESSGYFRFNNLTDDIYVVKQIKPKYCFEYWPPSDGIGSTIVGDGYPDTVVKYYDSGEGVTSGMYGGMVNDPYDWNQQIDYGNVLGYDESTFVTIPKDSYIILKFINESIKNTDGYDINIESFGNNNAKIYISEDNIDYKYLGDTYSSNSSFELSDIKYMDIVKYIKLVGNGKLGVTKGFNLINVKSYINSIGVEPEAYTINLANLAKGEYPYFPIFVNLCDYELDCNSYCNYYPILESEICKMGCNLTYTNYTCDIFKDNNITECNHGYNYELRRYVYPNYTVIDNRDGLIYGEYASYDDNNIITGLDECSSNTECKGLSYGDGITLFNNKSTNLIYKLDHTFVLKSEYLLDNETILDLTIPSLYSTTPTTSQTSTETSSPTLTVSITPTSTETSSPTSTVSITHTKLETINLKDTSYLTKTELDTSTQTTNVTGTESIDTSSSSAKKINSILITLFGIVIVLLLCVIIGLIFFRPKKINNTHTIGSYSNPVYDMTTGRNSLYQDIDSSETESESHDENYIELGDNSLTVGSDL